MFMFVSWLKFKRTHLWIFFFIIKYLLQTVGQRFNLVLIFFFALVRLSKIINQNEYGGLVFFFSSNNNFLNTTLRRLSATLIWSYVYLRDNTGIRISEHLHLLFEIHNARCYPNNKRVSSTYYSNNDRGREFVIFCLRNLNKRIIRFSITRFKMKL